MVCHDSTGVIGRPRFTAEISLLGAQLLVLLLLLGCSAVKEVEYKEDRVIKGNFSARSKPARVFEPGHTSLLKEGYVRIGTLTVRHLDARTYPDSLDGQLRKEAARLGADGIELIVSNKARTHVEERKECLRSRPVYMAFGGGGIVCEQWVHKDYVRTPFHESVGMMWRQEPKLAATQLAAARFYEAIGKNDPDAANRLVDARVDLNNPDIWEQATPLRALASRGRVEDMRKLIGAGARVGLASGPHRVTPLQAAASLGHTEAVRLLLDHKAPVNAANEAGWTALHGAARKGSTELAALLLEHGAAPNLTAYQDYTPLHLAAENGHAGVVELLLKHGADPERMGHLDYRPLHLAAENGHAKVVELLLDAGAVPNARSRHPRRFGPIGWPGYTALFLAARKGHAEVVKVLLEHGQDPLEWQGEKRHPFQIAVEKGHAETVRMFLDAGVDPNAEFSYLVWTDGKAEKRLGRGGAVVAAAQYPAVVELLVHRGANVEGEQDGLTALGRAIRNLWPESVETLIRLGADPNRPVGTADSALAYARSRESFWRKRRKEPEKYRAAKQIRTMLEAAQSNR